MPSPTEYLISSQHETGGWGYKTGHKSVIEPTAVVLLALRDSPEAESAIRIGIDCLLSSQNQDGGWGINPDDHESGWHTAWALLALKNSRYSGDAITRAVDWLTYVSTYKASQDELKAGQINPGTPSDIIWPWLPGLAGWIEPTASALLALEGLSRADIAEERIAAALDYFKQYRTPIGGWDMGNAGEYDTVVLPRGYPTALVLLALIRTAPDQIVSADITAQYHAMQEDPSLLVQASGLLALRMLGKNDQAIYSTIMSSQASNGSWDDNPFFTAWAMLSLRGFL